MHTYTEYAKTKPPLYPLDNPSNNLPTPPIPEKIVYPFPYVKLEEVNHPI